MFMKLITIIKWLLILAVILYAVDLIVGPIIAGSNQRKIDEFTERIGARSLLELARQTDGLDNETSGGDLISGNGWHLYMSALAALPNEDADRALKESALDEAHLLLQKAVAAPYTLSTLNYSDPLSMRVPHAYTAMQYMELAIDSAREHADKGDTMKAGERLLDVMAMVHGVLKPPLLILHAVTTSACKRIAESTPGLLQSLSRSQLEKLNQAVNALDLEKSLKNCLAGEVFFGLSGWAHMGSDPVSDPEGDLPVFSYKALRLPLATSLLELDKSVYLDLMLTLAEDPTEENAKRISREGIPFYAIVTAIICPNLERLVSKNQKEAQQKWLELKESLRVELERRNG